LIDSLLRIEDSDILIGIFWKRFGTPVEGAKSGTEHEFQEAYNAWKKQGRPQILFYFKRRAYELKSKQEADQLGQVLEFKQSFPEEGLYWEYKTPAMFERLVRTHLTKIIRNLRNRKPRLLERPVPSIYSVRVDNIALRLNLAQHWHG
jgi:hypothetical protein